tara:strand:+ start:214 stop:384 length:171 start_codon:yes stop_codon:yes gene_type:complete
MKLKENNRAEFYQWYLNQSQEEVDKVMKKIRYKNKLHNIYGRLQNWGRAAGQAIRN